MRTQDLLSVMTLRVIDTKDTTTACIDGACEMVYELVQSFLRDPATGKVLPTACGPTRAVLPSVT